MRETSPRSNFLSKKILAVIDFFHPPFKKLIPLQTFRYLACGGGLTVTSLLIFFISYNFILSPFVHPEIAADKTEEWITVGGISITRYISAYLISLFTTFPIGFFLSKYVVFQESQLKGRIQLFRYATLQLLNIGTNYYLLHFLVGYCGFWATPSQTLSAALIAIFSYFFQKYVSFRSVKK